MRMLSDLIVPSDMDGCLKVRAGSVGIKVFGGIMLGMCFLLFNSLFSSMGPLVSWPALLMALTPPLLCFLLALVGLRWVLRLRELMTGAYKRLITAFMASLACLAAQAWGMSFEKQERCMDGLTPRCQLMILATGQIDKDSPKQFKSFAQNFPKGTWVAVSSPGGNLMGGMQLGLAIRELGFNTTIGNSDYSPPDCLSACAYAFAGGVSRKLTPGSRYGLHQFRGSYQAINAEDTQKISATLAKYLDAMGVDRRLLDYAQMTTSDKVTVLTLTQAQLLKVDTAGQTSYARWKVEVTPDSKLLAINSSLFTVGSQIPVTLGILPVPGQNNKVACLIYYKSNDVSAFSASNPQHFEIGKEIYPLTPAGNWQEKTGGYQATFLIPDNLLNALLQAPDDTVITLSGSFSKPPQSNTTTASTNPLTAYFGVGNLKNSLQALLKR